MLEGTPTSETRPKGLWLRRRSTVACSAVILVCAATMFGLPASVPAAAAGQAIPNKPAPAGWTAAASLPTSFTPRWDSSVAYLPPTQQMVLFGGAPKGVGDPWHNDTWLYINGDWSAGPKAPSALTPRGGAALAYFPPTGQLVLFGGAGSDWPPYNDTWLFDGSNWTQGPSAPAALTGRAGARMVYDPDIGKLVLFGGSGTAPYTDTWLFNGSKWTQGPAAPKGMDPRVDFGMTYNGSLGRVVVAGGDGGTDVWEFDGTGWTKGPDMSGPGPRERFMMDDDPDIGADYVYGGFGPGAPGQDLWYLQGSAWRQVSGSGTKPDARVDAGFAWYPPRSAFMLISGIQDTSDGSKGYRDCWWYGIPPGGGQSPAGAGGADSAGAGSAATNASSGRPKVPGALGGWNVSNAPPVIRAGATAQISAHDGAFWAAGKKISLRGAMLTVGGGTGQQNTLDQIAGWGMNVVRITFSWCDLESSAPVNNGDGTWTHSYDASAMDTLQQNVQWAQQSGLYVVVSLYGGDCSYFAYPGWLYQSRYNSDGITYKQTPDGKDQAQADWWSDDLQLKFWQSMWKYVANSLAGTSGLAGYELLNEPWRGNLPNQSSTTATILGGQLGVAKAIRTKDAVTTIFFSTRAGHGPGLPGADLSAWQGLGNVAFDLHDYFGGRWGDGVVENPVKDSYHEAMQTVFAITTSGTSTPPGYIGNTAVQVRYLDRVNRAVAPYGIPLFVGEFGDDDGDTGAFLFYGSVTSALNDEGVSWTVDYGMNHGITNGNGDLEPWGQIVVDAAQQ